MSRWLAVWGTPVAIGIVVVLGLANYRATERSAVDSFLSIGRKSAEVLLVGVRAAMAQGDRAAADIYARLLRRDFPNTQAAGALPQLLQAAPAQKQP